MSAFNKILVPVDFSINTEVAVKKALDLIEPENSFIYLFHVQSRSGISRFQAAEIYSSAMKLSQWRKSLQEDRVGIEIVSESVKAQSVEKAIIDKARQIRPDIIIIGKKSHHGLFSFLSKVSPIRLSRKIASPVLTVMPGAIFQKVKTIVVPVGLNVPKKKIELIIALRKKLRINVHLVTFLENKDHEKPFASMALVDTFRFLKDIVNCPLEFKVLPGRNIARSALRYAQEIKADMLVVNPETESRLTSISGRHISDELMPDSSLQIITVQP